MAALRMKHELLISFIGHVDLAYFGLGPAKGSGQPHEDRSPVTRLLCYLADNELLSPNARLVLLDDRPSSTAGGPSVRAQFCDRLAQWLKREAVPGRSKEEWQTQRERLCALGLTPVIREVPANNDDPTRLRPTYEQLLNVLKMSSAAERKSVGIHVSSGTPAMYAAAVMAGLSGTEQGLLYQTSAQVQSGHGVERLPDELIIGVRRRIEARGRAAQRQLRLPPGVVADDPRVASVYAKLLSVAQRVDSAGKLVLIRGPHGSGRWTAVCHAWVRRTQKLQMAPDTVCQFDEAPGAGLDALPEDVRLAAVRGLDNWPLEGLAALLARLGAGNGLVVFATCAAEWVVPTAIAGQKPLELNLPPLELREDVVAVGRAMAEGVGLFGGKIGSIAPDLLKGCHSLHEMRELLLDLAQRSLGTRHLTVEALEASVGAKQAQQNLDDLLQKLEEIGLSSKVELDVLLKRLRVLLVKLSMATHQGNQVKVAEHLSMSAAWVSKWNRRSPD